VNQPSIGQADFEFISRFVKDEIGLVLESGKEYLVQTRLGPLATTQGFESLEGLITALRRSPSISLKSLVLDAMTTNETLFFRDGKPFEGLKKLVIPELMEKRSSIKKLSIWCGAASTGQEPYSLSLMLHDNFPLLLNWDFKFLATDVCTQVLQKAREATYSQFEVNRGLPAPMLVKYFERNGIKWQLKESVRSKVDFKEMNLLGNWSIVPNNLDIIFMRNVLIYFDEDTKREIFRKIRKVLAPDGYFIVGGSEGVTNIDPNFDRVMAEGATFYRKKAGT
jgi:chemotaxis protein methyltransferase CheR